MQDRHKEITADENDIKQLQLHKHTRCKQSQHASSGLMIRGWLAWGSTNTSGPIGKENHYKLGPSEKNRLRLSQNTLSREESAFWPEEEEEYTFY